MSEQIPLPSDPPAATPPAAPPAEPPVAPPVAPDSWRSGLAADIQNHPVITDSKDLDSFVRQSINQSALIGRKGIIPPADDSPEEKNRYFGELGRPDKPEGYKFESVGLAQRTPQDVAFLDSLRPVMHGVGATDSQADTIVKGYYDILDKQLAERDTANTERAKLTTSNLQTKWGLAYEPRLALAERAGKQLFGEETLNAFAEATMADGSRVGDHPDFIMKLYDNLGSKMTEDELVGGSATAAILTPEGAQAEIDRLLTTDKAVSVPYFDRTHIEHDAVMKRLTALYKMATPPATEGGAA